MEQLVASCQQLDLVGGLPELGRIYLGLQPPCPPQRLILTAQASGQWAVKFLDSLATGHVVPNQLRHCPEQLLTLPPGAVTAASLTVKTR